MASLQQEPTGVFHIIVRIEGKRFKRSLGTKSEPKAKLRQDEIQETIDLIGRGKIRVPDGVEAISFVLANGDVSAIESAPKIKPNPKREAPTCMNLDSVFEQFFDAIPDGNLEADTLKMMHIHKRHLLRVLNPHFNLTELSGQELQKYINKRSREKTQYFVNKSDQASLNDNASRKFVSATTIRKEISTLGSVWRWGATIPIVVGSFPNRGLRYPKTDEKPPFQTWAEIQRQIDLGQLDFNESEQLWECLYLRTSEIKTLLKYVKQNANFAFIFPMFAFAAYTGARRSELLRSKRSDFDFDQEIVTIRERKRVKGRRSTRRVPLTPKLRRIMIDWFDSAHPGGTATFGQKTQGRLNPLPITRDQAHSHFRQTLKGGQWDRIKGWHCLRHSFISNLASAGVDQRIIDDFVGHATEEMRRRYRHLFPNVKQTALNSVFG